MNKLTNTKQYLTLQVVTIAMKTTIVLALAGLGATSIVEETTLTTRTRSGLFTPFVLTPVALTTSVPVTTRTRTPAVTTAATEAISTGVLDTRRLAGSWMTRVHEGFADSVVPPEDDADADADAIAEKRNEQAAAAAAGRTSHIPAEYSKTYSIPQPTRGHARATGKMSTAVSVPFPTLAPGVEQLKTHAPSVVTTKMPTDPRMPDDELAARRAASTWHTLPADVWSFISGTKEQPTDSTRAEDDLATTTTLITMRLGFPPESDIPITTTPMPDDEPTSTKSKGGPEETGKADKDEDKKGDDKDDDKKDKDDKKDDDNQKGDDKKDKDEDKKDNDDKKDKDDKEDKDDEDDKPSKSNKPTKGDKDNKDDQDSKDSEGDKPTKKPTKGDKDEDDKKDKDNTDDDGDKKDKDNEKHKDNDKHKDGAKNKDKGKNKGKGKDKGKRKDIGYKVPNSYKSGAAGDNDMPSKTAEKTKLPKITRAARLETRGANRNLDPHGKLTIDPSILTQEPTSRVPQITATKAGR